MAKTSTCIGILTSGGDSPGMNAAIRAVTRTAICRGFRVKGIYRGYDGLINGDICEFTTESVSNIIARGGTILKSARSKEFTTPEGRRQAYETLQREQIDALVVIGGNGSLTGARIFAQEFNVPCIGLPGTIDNDLYGTDLTIGYDTTLNTIVECVDKIRDTANSHEPSSLLKSWGAMQVFWLKTQPLPAEPKQPSFPRTQPMPTNWSTSSGAAFARARTPASSL